MTNRSKAKGTEAESSVVTYLHLDPDFSEVERRTLAGIADKGDIAGLPVVIEVKNCSRMDLAGWVEEALREAANAGCEVGVVWHKRRGTTDPGRWYVTMTGSVFLKLLRVYVRSIRLNKKRSAA